MNEPHAQHYAPSRSGRGGGQQRRSRGGGSAALYNRRHNTDNDSHTSDRHVHRSIYTAVAAANKQAESSNAVVETLPSPSPPVVHYTVTDLTTLKQAYQHSATTTPSNTQTPLAVAAAPSIQIILALLQQLHNDIQQAPPTLPIVLHLRFLIVLHTWLNTQLTEATITTTTTTSTATTAASSPVLSTAQCAQLSFLLQSLSCHSYREIRLIIAKFILSVVHYLSAAPSSVHLNSNAAASGVGLSSYSLCLLPSHHLQLLSTFGLLALDRLQDESVAVSHVYKQVVAWCGIRAAIETDNFGQRWKQRQQEQQKQKEAANFHTAAVSSPATQPSKPATPSAPILAQSTSSPQTALLDKPAGTGTPAASHHRRRGSATSVDSKDSTEDEVGDAASVSEKKSASFDDHLSDADEADLSSDSSSESDNEHGHVSADDQPKLNADDDDDEPETQSKHAMISAVIRAKKDKTNRNKTAEATPTSTKRKGARHRASSNQGDEELDVQERETSVAENEAEQEERVKAEQEVKDVEASTASSSVESRATKPLAPASTATTASTAPGPSSSVTFAQSSRVPLPVTLTHPPASAYQSLLSASQSSAYKAHQFTETLHSFLSDMTTIHIDHMDVDKRTHAEDSSSISHPPSSSSTMQQEPQQQQQGPAQKFRDKRHHPPPPRIEKRIVPDQDDEQQKPSQQSQHTQFQQQQQQQEQHRYDWLSYVLPIVHPSSVQDSQTSAFLSDVSISHHLQSYYGLTAAAKFLLQAQLKSPFGKEVATLSHIDRLLSTLLKQRLEKKQEDTNNSGHLATTTASTLIPTTTTITTMTSTTSTAGSSSSSKQLSVDTLDPFSFHPFTSLASISAYTHLSLFLYLLNKYITLAASPTYASFSNSTASTADLFYHFDRSTVLFFQQNIQSCQVFFTRITNKWLMCAMYTEDEDTVIHIGTTMLQSIEKSLQRYIIVQQGETSSSSSQQQPLLAHQWLWLMNEQEVLLVKEWVKTMSALCYAWMRRQEWMELQQVECSIQDRAIYLPQSFLQSVHNNSTTNTDTAPSSSSSLGSTTATTHRRDIQETSTSSSMCVCVPLSALFPWVNGMILQAQSRHEQAFQAYCNLLTPTFIHTTGSTSPSTSSSSSSSSSPSTHTPPASTAATPTQTTTTCSASWSTPGTGASASPASPLLLSHTKRILRRAIKQCLLSLHDWSRLTAWLKFRPYVVASLEEVYYGLACNQLEELLIKVKADKKHVMTTIIGSSLKLAINHQLIRLPSPSNSTSTTRSSSTSSSSSSSSSSTGGSEEQQQSSSPSSSVLLLDSDDRADLMEQYFLYGIVNMCTGNSPASSNAPSNTGSTSSSDLSAASASSSGSASSSLTQLQSLSCWDISGSFAYDQLTYAASTYSPMSSAPYSTAPCVSSLIHLSCITACATHSFAPLYSFLTTISTDPLFTHSLNTQDMMKVLQTIEALLLHSSSSSSSGTTTSTTATNPSPTSTASSFDQHISRSFLLHVLYHSLTHQNTGLTTRLLHLYSSLFPSASLSILNKGELCWIQTVLALQRNEMDVAIKSMWELHEKMLVMDKEKTSAYTSTGPHGLVQMQPIPMISIPIHSLDASTLNDTHTHDDAVPGSLSAATSSTTGAASSLSLSVADVHAIHLLRINRVLRTIEDHDQQEDQTVFNPVHERLLRTLQKFIHSAAGTNTPLTTTASSTAITTTSTSITSTSTTDTVRMLRSYVLSTACQLSPQHPMAWLTYAQWCQQQWLRLNHFNTHMSMSRSLQQHNITMTMEQDADYQQIQQLISQYESFTDTAVQSAIFLFRMVIDTVELVLQQRNTENGSGRPIDQHLAAPAQTEAWVHSHVSAALSRWLSDDESSTDNFLLPITFVHSLVKIIQQRLTRVLTYSRTALIAYLQAAQPSYMRHK